MSVDENNRARAIELGAFAYYWGAKSEGQVDPDTLSIALDAFEEGREEAADDFLSDYTFDVLDTYDRSEDWAPDAWVQTEALEDGSPHQRAMSWGSQEPNEYYGPHTPLIRIPYTSESSEAHVSERANANTINSWVVEDETEFLRQFLVVPYGAGSGEMFLRQDLGPLPTQLAEAIGALENYSILDEEADSQLRDEEEREAWDDWAQNDWARALEAEHPELEDLIGDLTGPELYELYQQAAEEANTHVEHNNGGVYFGDFGELATYVEHDSVEDI
jgi:hypothetical protein